MEQIGIETVLSKINDTFDVDTSALKSYGIRFLTEKGNKPMITVRKYTKGLKQKATGQDIRGKEYYNLQRNGVILLQDLESDHPKSIKTAMIFAFRDHESSNWAKVFH